jgi:hypothetical protein
MDDAKVRKLLASQSKCCDGLGLVWLRRRRQSEAFLGEICAALETDWFLWLTRYVFEDDA